MLQLLKYGFFRSHFIYKLNLTKNISNVIDYFFVDCFHKILEKN